MKALVGAFSVIVKPVVEPMDRFAALNIILLCIAGVSGAPDDGVPPRHPGELPEQQAEPADAGNLR